MKDRFLVLDSYLSEYSQHTTADAAIKAAREAAVIDDGYNEDNVYYVAQVLGKAENKVNPPQLAPYTALTALSLPKKKAAKRQK